MSISKTFGENIEAEMLIPANDKKTIFKQDLPGSQKWSIKKITAEGPREAKVIIYDGDVPINRHCQRIAGFPIKLGHDLYKMDLSSSLMIDAENPTSEDIWVRVVVEVVRETIIK